MRYLFPLHLNGGNRGCEGIAKGSALILNKPKEDLLGYCTDIDLDSRLRVSDYVTLVNASKQQSLCEKVIKKIRVTVATDSYTRHLIQTQYKYDNLYSKSHKGDVMISTGGDMLCYSNQIVCSTTQLAHDKGLKTVLWGCSMGPNNLDSIKERTLRTFDLIYARESLTYEFFLDLGLKNVVCLPDPAFVLIPHKTDLPKCFMEGKVVGINLSNFTVGADNLDTPFGKEVKKLIEYIIDETDYSVLLVPHVLWTNQDDRLIANSIKEEYKSASYRISILDSHSLNYLEIRYVISHCYMFIGARTHAVISAYSTSVPTIALGYSIKSKGIAKDLNLPEFLVVDTKKFKENELLDSFHYLENHNDLVHNHLSGMMTEYCKKPFEMRNYL